MNKNGTFTVNSERLNKINYLVSIQIALFGILFSIWLLPNTIFIRNFCLVIGALIGCYEIYCFRRELSFSRSLPLIFLIILFLWASIHLIFLTNNLTIQIQEFLSVWKRSLFSLFFGAGLGLSLANIKTKSHRYLWVIFYAGLLGPTIIYILKYLMQHLELNFGIEIPKYWGLYLAGSETPYYVAKTGYMGFCAPVIAVALGQLYDRIKTESRSDYFTLIYLITVPAILFIFINENIKNGILFSCLLILFFIALLIFKTHKTFSIKRTMVCIFLAILFAFFLNKNIEQNHSWKTLFADAKVAIQTDNFINWQCGTRLGYPKNEYGETVSVTNYERIAWSINAAKLVIKYPLGYGLIERSFGWLEKDLSPESCLTQSHSGWLDLAVGIGVPGILMIFASFFYALKKLTQFNLSKDSDLAIWRNILSCILFGLTLIWCTSEISQKIFFEELIFFLSFAGGLSVHQKRR